jgi:hypothetical protein
MNVGTNKTQNVQYEIYRAETNEMLQRALATETGLTLKLLLAS